MMVRRLVAQRDADAVNILALTLHTACLSGQMIMISRRREWSGTQLLNFCESLESGDRMSDHHSPVTINGRRLQAVQPSGNENSLILANHGLPPLQHMARSTGESCGRGMLVPEFVQKGRTMIVVI